MQTIIEPKFLTLLKETKINVTKAKFLAHGGQTGGCCKFDFSPKDFLRFAKEDLKEKGDRGIVNSLVNSKRAIDCQIDEAFQNCGINNNDFNPNIKKFISYFELNDDIPIKLKAIHALNLAPSILISKTRNLRNKLEHYYQKPSIEEAKEAVDIADLFIRSVDGRFKSLITECSITDEMSYNSNHLKYEKEIIFNYNVAKPSFKAWSRERAEPIIIDVNDIEYYALLRLMFSIDDGFELEESFKVLLAQIEHPIPTQKVGIIQVF